MFQPHPNRMALLCTFLLLGQPLMTCNPAWSASPVKPKTTAAFPWTATETLTLRKAKRTGNRALITTAYTEIGDKYLKVGQFPRAQAIYAQALDYARKNLPANHILTGLILYQMGTLSLMEEKFKNGLSQLSESVGILNQTPSMNAKVETINALINFLNNYEAGLLDLKSNYDGASAANRFQQILAYLEKNPNPALTSKTNYFLALALLLQDNYADAEKALAQALQNAGKSEFSAEIKLRIQITYAHLYQRQGQLEKAKTYYQQALVQPQAAFKDAEISKDHLAQDLTHLEKVQAGLQKISTLANAANYYPDVLWKQQVFHWNLNNGVIRVYIAPGTDIAQFTPEYIQRVKTACKKWQLALADRVRFYFTDNPDDPVDVTVHWQNQYNPQQGQTHCRQHKGKLSSATITLNLQDYNQELQAPEIVYRLALHEVGHVLGLMGHSQNPEDVMFPIMAIAKDLSLRDAATMRKLYQTQAQITNPSKLTLSEYRQTRQFQSIQSIDEAMEAHP